MNTLKTARAEALFAELAAEFINRESAGQSLITVTAAKESNRGRLMTVYVTVLPAERESDALDFLSRKRREFGAYVAERAKLRFLPSTEFVLDVGEKNRQRMDELLRQETERQQNKTA